MTMPKGTTRRRRKTTLSGIPQNIKEWFSGERRFTFLVYTYPYRAHLREYWKAWKAENPKAVMPLALKGLLNSPAYPINHRPGAEEEEKE